MSADVGESLVAVPAWSDPMVVAVPSRHPLLAHKFLLLDEVLCYPLVLCDPDVFEGCSRQLARTLRLVEREPIVAEKVASHEMMVTLIAAGYGLGFSTQAHISASNHPEIVTRPLAGQQPMLTTYLVRRVEEPNEPLQRFIERALMLSPPAAPLDGLPS